ncbi:MAG: ATP-binding cassette domain-containing protein [Chloroflexota bacterium]
MIRVEGLTKDYGSRRAINALTFEAQQGEVLGFLGPNGAGKTTTMRILTGYMPATSGTATVAGYDVMEESLEVRRRVGYLPETVPLYTDMTVFDYLKFMANLRHLPNPDDRVDETLELVGLLDRAEGYIGKLSKGMRQRVGLAQALLHRPEVLILDEPTIGLDPGQVVEVRNLIRDVGRERTVLLSTHILSEAQQICDRVLIINKGEIVAEDTPSNLQMGLEGATRLLVRINGDTAPLLEKFGEMEGVQAAKPGAQAGEIELHLATNAEMRPEIARMIVSGGFDLLELRPVGMSLEDIFLQLTRDNSANGKSKE